MDFSLWLREDPKTSDVDISNLTDRFASWRHSVKAIGGCWQGEGEYTAHPSEMERFFMTSVGKRVVAKSGGVDYWEGQIVRMEYTKGGLTFVRSMEEQANRVKIIYSRTGANLITNGDVESGSWFQYGTPSVAASSDTWFAKGTTSMCAVTDAANEGFVAGSSMTIDANRGYDCSMILSVASGVWSLSVKDEATSTEVAAQSTAGCGRSWLQCMVPDSNSYTTVDVQILSSAAGEEMYADGAILRPSPVRSETKWHEESNSASAHGRIEAVFLEREMSDDEADGLAERLLSTHAWVRTQPPERGQVGGRQREDRLIVTCMGMFWTLTWRHALTDGTGQADTTVTNLIDESEFIASSDAIIDTNTTEVFVDSTNPTHLWREIERIALIGDGSGTAWTAGVYPGWEFRYEERPTGTLYRYQNGQLANYGGGIINPLEFRPHWCWMADMPTEPIPAGATDDDDPKRVWLDEVWVMWDGRGTSLEWSREQEK